MEPGVDMCKQCGFSSLYAPPSSLTYTPPIDQQSARKGTGGATSNAELMARARDSLRGRWGLAIGTYVVYMILVGFISSVPIAGSIAMIIVGGPFVCGLAIFSLAFVRNENARMEQIFDGFSRFGNAVGTYLLSVLFIYLWMLLLIIPGIIAAYSYAMAMYIIADDENVGPMEAIKRSKDMMRGYKFKLFCLGCRFIGWTLLGFLSMGIGFLWIIPYMSMSFANFYDDLLPPVQS